MFSHARRHEILDNGSTRYVVRQGLTALIQTLSRYPSWHPTKGQEADTTQNEAYIETITYIARHFLSYANFFQVLLV